MATSLGGLQIDVDTKHLRFTSITLIVTIIKYCDVTNNRGILTGKGAHRI